MATESEFGQSAPTARYELPPIRPRPTRERTSTSGPIALPSEAWQNRRMFSREDALKRTFSAGHLARSMAVAVVIGTLLNAINQGPELVSGHPLVIWKLTLTYLVPFAVASYGCYCAFRSSL